MNDATKPSLFTETRRTRARRRAELRMRGYGVLAITLAALALLTLLSTVVFKAGGALTESYVTLPVLIDEAEIDPDGARDPKTILRADFGGLTKGLLRETFPQVTARKDKRELYDILSSGASFELADHVSANSDLVGQTIAFDFLASDVTDLYLKGAYGQMQPIETRGALTVFINKKEATVSSTSNDFAGVLTTVKEHLIVDAQRLRIQAARQDAGVIEFLRRADAAESDEVRQENTALAEQRTAERDRLLAEADDLEKRARGVVGTEDLTRNNRSLIIRAAGGWIKLTELDATYAKGVVLAPLAASDTDHIEDWELFQTDLPEIARKVSDKQMVWIETLREMGAIESVFNKRFFTAADSREPELAGIRGAAVGTFWTMLVTFILAFPVGVLAAIYLQEFAPKNRLTRIIEVNINNLAAVPSIVFGLLGLAVFLGVFGVPRSAPLAGGIVLALMTLPTIIIASRAAIAAVPPSIREAALGVGASRVQTSFHHVLPLAMPGILTGTIIGMAQALGETAPLILIGMVAFIVEVPGSVTDSATVLPVQVFRWSDFPERAFEAKTAAAICVLLLFLVAMNAIAIILRRKFERRW